VVGTEIVEPVAEVGAVSESSDMTLSSGAIVGIIIAGVVLFLVAAGLTAFCCYKKHVFNKNKTGVEVVTVQKTRGNDASIKKEAGRLSYQRASKFDDCPKVHTEEEDISGTED
jgi:hypothetical protein